MSRAGPDARRVPNDNADDRVSAGGDATADVAGAAGTSEAIARSVETIGAAAGRGLRWSLLGNVVLRLGSFTMGLVLARLLVPEDFGVYAVALAVLNFVIHVNDVGVIAATVQWRGELDEMAPTGATIAFLMSLLTYGIFWLTAPALAALAGSPDATSAIRLLTVVILVDGITAVRAGALMRRFQQDKLAKANLVGFVVNATLAISLGASGAGPFSFIGGQVAGAVVTGALILAYARIPLKVEIDRAVVRRLLRFGLPLAASLGVEAVLLNADFIVVGHQLGAAAVGIYLLAFNLSSWLQGMVGTAVRHVSIAGFSRLAEEGALAVGVARSVPFLVALVIPVAVVMAVVAPALIIVLYGDRWSSAAPALRFLVLLMIVRLLTSFAFDVLTSAGATVRTLWMNVWWLVALLPALVVGTYLDGIRGTAIAHAIVAVLVAGPVACVLVRRAGVRLRPILPALVRPILAGVPAALACLLVARVTDFSPVVQLVSATAACLAVYMTIVVPVVHLRRWVALAVAAPVNGLRAARAGGGSAS